MWPYDLAKTKEPRSPDGRFTAIVQEDLARIPQIKLHDHEYNVIVDLTATSGWSFDPVWSPQGDKIAFVSQESGNDEIYIISPDGQGMQRLTHNTWEWDKHPTWSPDGNQIVFWSNRDTGRRQLWIMDKDGNNQRKLLDSSGHDWNPVWVK
jgi:TolB protein